MRLHTIEAMMMNLTEKMTTQMATKSIEKTIPDLRVEGTGQNELTVSEPG